MNLRQLAVSFDPGSGIEGRSVAAGKSGRTARVILARPCSVTNVSVPSLVLQDAHRVMSR